MAGTGGGGDAARQALLRANPQDSPAPTTSYTGSGSQSPYGGGYDTGGSYHYTESNFLGADGKLHSITYHQDAAGNKTITSPGAGVPYTTVFNNGDGKYHYVDIYGQPLGPVAPKGGGGSPFGGAGSGPSAYTQMTKYEAAQVALDNKRLADAEAQQKAAQQLAESQAVEKFNSDYRTFQEKSPYGAQYGPTYFSPAGAVFAQRAPESTTLKQAFKDAGQVDPWSVSGNVPAGYTGVGYANAQHPGLVDFGQPQIQPGPQAPSGPTSTPMPGGGTTGGHGFGNGTPWGTSGPPTINPPFGHGADTPPSLPQMQQWHDIAHQLPQASAQQPSNPQALPGVPVFDQGGTVPGPIGTPQLIQAEGGETVNPVSSGDWFNSWHQSQHQSDPYSGGYGIPAGGSNPMPSGPVSHPFGHGAANPPQPSGGGFPWGHGAMNPPIGSGSGFRMLGASTGQQPAVQPPHPNSYGQSVGPQVMYGAPEDIRPSPMGYNPETQQFLSNHVQYGPELTGLSGFGGLITPNGTPVVMSAWQRAQFDPTSIANYGDYAHAIAGWSPDDLTHAGTTMTGNIGDLTRPSNWAPIGIQPSPSGG